MKIGVAGSGKIVTDALDAMKEVEKIEVRAICGRERSMGKLERFSRDYGIPKIYTDYDMMLGDEEVEVIYVAIVNNLHFEYTKRALEAGKHVICEKPFTSNLEELRVLADLAREKKLFLFEAVTLLYSPNFKYVRDNLEIVGEIKMVQCNYSQYSSRYDKYLEGVVLPAFDISMSGGSLYDINIYNIHFTVALFGKPNKVSYNANIGFNGIDTSGAAILTYDGFTAICCGAKDSQSPGHGTIQGTKGYLKVDSPVSISESVEVFIEGKSSTHSEKTSDNRMVDEFTAFEEIFRTDNFEECYSYLKHSEIVMEVLVEARKDAGIEFPADLV